MVRFSAKSGTMGFIGESNQNIRWKISKKLGELEREQPEKGATRKGRDEERVAAENDDGDDDDDDGEDDGDDNDDDDIAIMPPL